MPTIGSVESGAWTLTPTALIIASVTSILFYITYLWLLPKPIPGIPYNKDSAKRILGDIPRLNALAEAGDAPRMLWTIAAPELRSPIAQVFLGPTNKPIVIVSDYREINDLQLRSAKALARGWFNQGLWRGLIPEHFIAMENYDAGYKDAKGLGKDLMTPKFLHEVGTVKKLYTSDNWLQLIAYPRQGQRTSCTCATQRFYRYVEREDANRKRLLF